MTGFVDEAKGKAYITEARTAYVALQSKVTEHTAVDSTYYTTNANATAHLNALKGDVSGKQVIIKPGESSIVE